jgi:hypothetical protein|tara:strand:- start:661 stop:828 length:168 start_codon:yes stop_codon:yes gene_type:complete
MFAGVFGMMNSLSVRHRRATQSVGAGRYRSFVSMVAAFRAGPRAGPDTPLRRIGR